MLTFCGLLSLPNTRADNLPDENTPLLKVAILPFENQTPNPNMDWVSTLFVDSYKNQIQKRFHVATVSDVDAAKAFDLIQEYHVVGKVRYQVFAALTRADIVVGGYFTESGQQTLVVQSQIFYTRTNRFEELARQETAIDSAQLFSAVDSSAADSATSLGKALRVVADGESKPYLTVSHLPRLLYYLVAPPQSANERKKLFNTIRAHLNATNIYQLTIRDIENGALKNSVEIQAQLERDNAAFAIVAIFENKRLHARLYRKSPLANIFETNATEPLEKSIATTTQQLAAHISTLRFEPHVAVQGLRGKDLEIEVSGVKKAQTSANGELRLDARLPIGADYVLTLGNEPHSPQQRCFILNATGKVTLTGTDHVGVVCITKRYAVEGVLENLNGGTVAAQLNALEPVTLKDNGPFRFVDTLEDYERFTARVAAAPRSPRQQCAFVGSDNRVEGKSAQLRLYCMPPTEHWLFISGGFPLVQYTGARGDTLTPNGDLPMNNMNGNFSATVGYWARYYLKFRYLLGGELNWSYFKGNADLYTGNGRFVEAGEALNLHVFSANLLLGYPFALPGKWLAATQLVVFGGLGPRYFNMSSPASILLLSTLAPGATLGFTWQYEFWDKMNIGLRYHIDASYITSEPLFIQHVIGLQLGYRL